MCVLTVNVTTDLHLTIGQLVTTKTIMMYYDAGIIYYCLHGESWQFKQFEGGYKTSNNDSFYVALGSGYVLKAEYVNKKRYF